MNIIILSWSILAGVGEKLTDSLHDHFPVLLIASAMPPLASLPLFAFSLLQWTGD